MSSTKLTIESDDAVIVNMSADMKQSGDIYGPLVTAVSIFTDKYSTLDSSTFNSIKLKLTTAM
jgi:hypothetical protein